MDCCNNNSGYNDYRHNVVGGANSPYHHNHHHQHHLSHHHPSNHNSPYNFHHPSNIRYPQASNFRNTNGNTINNHIGYERFGYTGNGYTGYNNTPYGYNSNNNSAIESRSNQFYAQQQSYTTYEPYNNTMPMPPTNNNNYPSSYSYHQRDFHSNYESSAMYRSKNSYMMRDIPPYHPYANNREYQSNGTISRGDYYPVLPNSNGSGFDQTLSQHHHLHPYQSMHESNYTEYLPNSTVSNQYAADPNGLSPNSATALHFSGKESRMRKSHRDRSLSKLVAMNRRLESQINENERLGTVCGENFDYYTDYSETPDSIASNNYTHNDHGNNSESMLSNEATWLGSPSHRLDDEFLNTKQSEKDINLQQESKINISDVLPTSNLVTRAPIKQKANKKINKISDGGPETIPIRKRRRRKDCKKEEILNKTDDLIKSEIIPLPGFQQAFGSTEIGRFSEIFFNLSESPIELSIFESEADTLSPQPWETGDSLEGPHFSLPPNVSDQTPAYADSYGSTDSPSASNNSCFGDIRTPEF